MSRPIFSRALVIAALLAAPSVGAQTTAPTTDADSCFGAVAVEGVLDDLVAEASAAREPVQAASEAAPEPTRSRTVKPEEVSTS